MKTFRVLTSSAIAATLCAMTVLPADAQLQGGVTKKSTSGTGIKGYLNSHPKVKGATVGAGVGTAAGALTGLVSGKGVLRGAAIGAGTGAGVGVIQTSKTMKRHPLVKDSATGALAGAGLGWAASKGRGTGKNVAKSAAVGTAVGLGVGLFKKLKD